MIGSARESSQSQKMDRQLEALKGAGCMKIFEEKSSGASRDREGLNVLLDSVREGETVVCFDGQIGSKPA